MSFSAQLWETYYTDALASLYNPFVMGLANGTLPKAAFVEYIQQDSYYLDIYEKAYTRAVELAHEKGYPEFEQQIKDLMKGITDKKEKHLKRAAERGEKIEQPRILRATKDYTDLLMKAANEGSLVDIVCAICPCAKLYGFIGQEIAKAIPNHNHEYSEWINVYADAEMNTSVRILDNIIDTLITEETKKSAEFYYAEAMRLEFEFFLQQDHVYAAPTTKIFSVAAGCLCCGSEIECTHECEGKVDKEGLCAFIANLPACEKKCCCEERKKWDERIREWSINYGKTVVELTDFKPSEQVSCGYGSFRQLPLLLETSLPIVIAPTASEVKAMESYGYKVQRLFTVEAYSINDLPKDTVFFVDHIFEIGMALMGTAFYPNQHFDTLPTTLIIAGSDNGGEAGMQADIKACAAMGSFSTTAFTVLTAQNTRCFKDLFFIPLEWIENQIDSVMQDFRVDCVKTGMLGNKDIAHLIARKLKEYNVKNYVCDPCIYCRSGDTLMTPDTIPVVKAELIPLAIIITPNYKEACTLLDYRIPRTIEGIKKAACELKDLGCQNVYLKGGQLDGSDQCCDVLCSGDDKHCDVYIRPFVQSRNANGCGCTLASSIAAGISKGLSVKDAVKEAKDYINGAVAAGRFLHLGKGMYGPFNHLYRCYPCQHH